MHDELNRSALGRVIRLARTMQRDEVDLDPTSVCLALIRGDGPPRLRDAVQAFDGDAFDYVVASIYTLLLPAKRRKELGAYFTPPQLVRHLLDRMCAAGLDCLTTSVHDPAAGGAAFVVPLVRRTVLALMSAGAGDAAIPGALAERLSGVELDPGLACISNALVARTLRREFGIEAPDGFALVQVGNSLIELASPSDAVIGNPPYAKVGATAQRVWARDFPDILGGQLNLYALFLRRATDQVRPGGLVGFIVPTSFLSGPEFRSLRVALLQRADILHIDLIEKRKDVFLDVIQDACFVVFRRHAASTPAQAVATAYGVLTSNGDLGHQGTFCPPKDGSPWMRPATEDSPVGGATLADYGFRCAVGYLVVNRQPGRLSGAPGPGHVPLVRARCVRTDGSFDIGVAGMQYVSGTDGAKYVVREPCVAIQRTSNRKQPRRINAAPVLASVMDEHGGIVGENHVLFLVAESEPSISVSALARLMNSNPVNSRFSRLCGTVSISAKLLSQLDLPPPDLVAALDTCQAAETDFIVDSAYRRSATSSRQITVRAA